MYTIMCISGNTASVFHRNNLVAIVTGVRKNTAHIAVWNSTSLDTPVDHSE